MNDVKFQVFQEIRSLIVSHLVRHDFTPEEAREVGELLTEDLPSEVTATRTAARTHYEGRTVNDDVRKFCMNKIGIKAGW